MGAKVPERAAKSFEGLSPLPRGVMLLPQRMLRCGSLVFLRNFCHSLGELKSWTIGQSMRGAKTFARVFRALRR
jgi:hypothetical protein